MLDRLARMADRRPWRIVVVAILFFVIAGIMGSSVAQRMGPYGAEDASSESIRADHALREAGFRPADTTVLIRGVNVRESARDRDRVSRIRQQILDRPGIESVDGFAQTGSAAFLSRTGDATLLTVAMKSTSDKTQQKEALSLSEDLAAEPGVRVGGIPMVNEQMNHHTEQDLKRAEILVFPLLLLLSLLFFRSLVAALLPLLVGAFAIVGTFLGLRIATEIGSVSFFALNLTTGLGLGLAIDYSLFIVSRYREEIARIGPGVKAMRRTMSTAGRSVLFSALTVAASMAALLTFPQRFLYSMGLGGVLVSLLAAVVALTLLPAVLTLLGGRVNALAPRFLERRASQEAAAREEGFWYRLSRLVMSRPLPIAAFAATLLIVVALPALRTHFVSVDATTLPPGDSARVVQETLDRDFPAAANETVRVVVRGDRKAAGKIAAKVAATPGIARVAPPRQVGPGLQLIEAPAGTGYMEDPTRKTVDHLRELTGPPGTEVLVTGGTARFTDFQQSLSDHLPLALAIIVLATLVILFLMTGSVVLPIKSLLMNVLTLGAVFGLLVLIFEDGNLSGLLAFESPGGLDQSTPILILAITFGLSTDYAVFLLSRIKEAWDSGLPNNEAIAAGLERTGRIVTAAALLFALAVGAFAISQIVFIKVMGVGTALAVLIDATIIRALLVPSLMEMLGRWNWWAPGPLRRLHDRFGMSESEPAPESST
ncbi:MAG: MMPL family transporter [Solirubrobacterales bacterium]|nr:MMPL family transporter [Solirubrobacterales bacterium]